jgi:hypothetical protein
MWNRDQTVTLGENSGLDLCIRAGHVPSVTLLQATGNG